MESTIIFSKLLENLYFFMMNLYWVILLKYLCKIQTIPTSKHLCYTVWVLVIVEGQIVTCNCLLPLPFISVDWRIAVSCNISLFSYLLFGRTFMVFFMLTTELFKLELIGIVSSDLGLSPFSSILYISSIKLLDDIPVQPKNKFWNKKRYYFSVWSFIKSEIIPELMVIIHVWIIGVHNITIYVI